MAHHDVNKRLQRRILLGQFFQIQAYDHNGDELLQLVIIYFALRSKRSLSEFVGWMTSLSKFQLKIANLACELIIEPKLPPISGGPITPPPPLNTPTIAWWPPKLPN